MNQTSHNRGMAVVVLRRRSNRVDETREFAYADKPFSLRINHRCECNLDKLIENQPQSPEDLFDPKGIILEISDRAPHARHTCPTCLLTTTLVLAEYEPVMEDGS